MARPIIHITAGKTVTIVTETSSGKTEEYKKVVNSTKNSVYIEDILIPFARNGQSHEWNERKKVYIRELYERDVKKVIYIPDVIVKEQFFLYVVDEETEAGYMPKNINQLIERFDEYEKAIAYLKQKGNKYKKYVILEGRYCEVI